MKNNNWRECRESVYIFSTKPCLKIHSLGKSWNMLGNPVTFQQKPTVPTGVSILEKSPQLDDCVSGFPPRDDGCGGESFSGRFFH
ncbi:hypothetical protein YC2023_059569 [Brassica napus]